MSDEPTADSPDSGFEIIDHTADIGIRVRAADWHGLLRSAAWGMLACIGDLKRLDGAAEERISVRLEAGTRTDLLRDWLAEILYYVERRRWTVVAIPELRADGRRLDAIVAFAAYDPESSTLRRELKAVTYHDLRVEQSPGGLTGAVIFDI